MAISVLHVAHFARQLHPGCHWRSLPVFHGLLCPWLLLLPVHPAMAMLLSNRFCRMWPSLHSSSLMVAICDWWPDSADCSKQESSCHVHLGVEGLWGG